jgi:hypothetical protein
LIGLRRVDTLKAHLYRSNRQSVTVNDARHTGKFRRLSKRAKNNSKSNNRFSHRPPYALKTA